MFTFVKNWTATNLRPTYEIRQGVSEIKMIYKFCFIRAYICLKIHVVYKV